MYCAPISDTLPVAGPSRLLSSSWAPLMPVAKLPRIPSLPEANPLTWGIDSWGHKWPFRTLGNTKQQKYLPQSYRIPCIFLLSAFDQMFCFWAAPSSSSLSAHPEQQPGTVSSKMHRCQASCPPLTRVTAHRSPPPGCWLQPGELVINTQDQPYISSSTPLDGLRVLIAQQGAGTYLFLRAWRCHMVNLLDTGSPV